MIVGVVAIVWALTVLTDNFLWLSVLLLFRTGGKKSDFRWLESEIPKKPVSFRDALEVPSLWIERADDKIEVAITIRERFDYSLMSSIQAF